MSIVRLNRVSCRQGREEEFERRLAAVIGATRSDPACEFYSWFRSSLTGEAITYINLSRWRTIAGWERHLASEVFAGFQAQEASEPCLSGPPEHQALSEVDSNA